MEEESSHVSGNDTLFRAAKWAPPRLLPLAEAIFSRDYGLHQYAVSPEPDRIFCQSRESETREIITPSLRSSPHSIASLICTPLISNSVTSCDGMSLKLEPSIAFGGVSDLRNAAQCCARELRPLPDMPSSTSNKRQEDYSSHGCVLPCSGHAFRSDFIER